MLRALPVAVGGLLLFSSLLQAQSYPNIAPSDPKTPEEERQTFKLPPGFEAQLVASEPDIRKPIQMAFDAKGRLWVTTSEEYPFPARGKPGKDRLYVLEDFGADGKAKKVSIFADDLNIPIGVLPLPDCKSVIVSSIDPGEGKPDGNEKLTCWIWKLTDTDGDGKYDKKEKLYGPFGCDDTHGMNNSYTLMPDGWVYACHGFKNDSKPKGADGHEIVMNSGNTFRFRPDGSRIEIWARGQVNPFGIAVDPYFNLYTADCHSKPITQLVRGATYQSFSKPHDGLGFAPHVTIHGHDSTALCGLVYYAADHFPKEYLDCMFLGNVTSNCINLDKIEFKGSTPVGIDKGQFLSSNDLWFRPTDIKLGPDGALYFADFYNRIIGHYEVKLDHPGRDKLRGRVWRIIYRGADGKGESPKMIPDLTKATARELFEHLGNSNLAVRIQVLNQMRLRGPDVLVGLDPPPAMGNDSERSAYLLWILGRFDKTRVELPTAKLFEALNTNENALVAAHTVKVLDAFDLGFAFDTALAKLGLDFKNSRARRAAVESLISHSDSNNARALLDAFAKSDAADSHLRHSIRVALREAVLSLADWDTEAYPDPWTLEQVKLLADIALAAPTPAAAEFLVKHLHQFTADSPRLLSYVEHVARHAEQDDVSRTNRADTVRGRLVQFIESQPKTDSRNVVQLVLAYQQGLQKRGERQENRLLGLADRLVQRALAAEDPNEVQAAIELAAAFKLSDYADRISVIAESRIRPDGVRLAAISALAVLDPNKSPAAVLGSILNDPNASIAVREKAAQALAGTNRDDAHEELVKGFQYAPNRLQTAMAVGLANSNKGAEILLKAVEAGKASARLLQDKTVQTRLNERKLPKTAERVAALTKGLPSPDEKMTKLLVARNKTFAKSKPDATLGKLVFTKNCAICHQIGNEGTKIGPQLDGIGGRGLDRLLEDVLDPNRNVDAAFRTTIVTTTDGKNISGLLLREEGQILVMADDKGKEVRIAKSDIEDKRSSLLSPMPANVAEIISEKDFYDLLAYLLTQRAKEK